MKLFNLLRRGERSMSVDDYADVLKWSNAYGVATVGPSGTTEDPLTSFIGYTRQAYMSNGPVFAAMLARHMILSEARFVWQQMVPRPGLYTIDDELNLLDRPWPGGSASKLVSRMVQDADLSGNFYARKERVDGVTRLRRLRPDWVQIVLTADPAVAVESDIAGYIYTPGGGGADGGFEVILPEEIVHWAPNPDPLAQYRGMSWLTPVVREIQADGHATEHKLSFFRNGAALGNVVALKESVTPSQFREYVRAFTEAHGGSTNAYKNVFVGGGATVTPVTADMRQIDFKSVQGAGETRIAMVSGMHPVIIGMSEGLDGSSLNAGNFNSARRLVADKTLRPLWKSMCQALSNVMRVPPQCRLTVDESDIAFLREDRADLATILARNAQTLRSLVDTGWEPNSARAAVVAGDLSLVEHTGRLSVQLQRPEDNEPAADPEDLPATEPDDEPENDEDPGDDDA